MMEMHTTSNSRPILLASLAAVFACTPMGAFAADTMLPPALTASSGAARVPRLDTARELIAAEDWPRALEELRRIDAYDSADWNNLMGYVIRKGPGRNWEASSRHYAQALKIDPRHRGALAYSGELALERGELAMAEERKATLEQVCGREACAELEILRRALTEYRSRTR